MRERLLNQATTRRGGKEGEEERRMGALKTEPSLASVGEGRQKKPFLFSVVSLSLSLPLVSARVSLPFDRPPSPSLS